MRRRKSERTKFGINLKQSIYKHIGLYIVITSCYNKKGDLIKMNDKVQKHKSIILCPKCNGNLKAIYGSSDRAYKLNNYLYCSTCEIIFKVNFEILNNDKEGD